MLTHLKNKLNALQKFSFEDELKKIVTDNKDRLAELQREQLYSGKDANSNPITLNGRGYSPFTIRIKTEKGQVTSRVTWKDTGELYATLKAEIRASTFAIKSDNFKFQKMVNRSGEDAVGLNVDSRKVFINEVTRPGILAVYKRKVTDV